MSKIEGNVSRLRARSVHFVSYLPLPQIIALTNDQSSSILFNEDNNLYSR
ncbi:MAG: hypothetical protein JO215_10325 [Ktedonobacteraceae bacterium]|nr:hypothetical protein [Ktedonobacteraceae bacterium]